MKCPYLSPLDGHSQNTPWSLRGLPENTSYARIHWFILPPLTSPDREMVNTRTRPSSIRHPAAMDVFCRRPIRPLDHWYWNVEHWIVVGQQMIPLSQMLEDFKDEMYLL